MSTIDILAEQLNRLDPTSVDRESGYVGHDRHPPIIGYQTAGTGHPIFQIAATDIPEACQRLATLPDGALDADLGRGPWSDLKIIWL